ncbi:acyl-coenzyme A amino acid N-acyltransferase 1-like [Argonauta hians]
MWLTLLQCRLMTGVHISSRYISWTSRVLLSTDRPDTVHLLRARTLHSTNFPVSVYTLRSRDLLSNDHSVSVYSLKPRALLSTDHSVTVSINPKNSLVDQPVCLTVSGLKPHQEVTVSASIHQKSSKRPTTFRSFGHFRASPDGFVNLSTDPSLMGTYSGVHAMGLFWSMEQVVGKHSRIVSSDARKPLEYTISVHPGHILQGPESTLDSDVLLQPLATTTVQRHFMKPGVRRIEVEDGRLRGSLFLPENTSTDNHHKQKYPAVIDLFGGAGGLIESRAALLASHGFVALSLAYFGYKDLPSHTVDVDYEYFEEAVSWLDNHEQVLSKNGIGVVGTSLGGEIALYMAKTCPRITTAISVNGQPTFYVFTIRQKGEPLFQYCGSMDCVRTQAFKDYYMARWKIDHSKTFSLDEGNGCKVLVIISGDDKILYPNDYYQWADSLPPSKRKDVEFVEYSGAGHLLEPPYTPLFYSCYASYFGSATVFGGETKAHALAQEKSWLKIREYLTENLSGSI